MAQFMIQISLPEYMDDEFLALIPEQRAYVDQLMSENVITGYSLSLDKCMLWVTLNAKNERTADKLIRSFPIAPFIDFTISELAFHNVGTLVFPSLSLN